MDVTGYDRTSECALVLVTILYTASLIVSAQFKNYHSWTKTCYPFIPFGECIISEHALEDTRIQYWISFVVTLLAGAWSDSHGKRRKPLMVIAIIGEIVTDCLRFMAYHWNLPWAFQKIFVSIVAGSLVGRNLFWIGAMSYVTERSTVESRTLKLATIIASHTTGYLLGLVLVMVSNCRALYSYRIMLFILGVVFYTAAALICYYYVKSHSDSYDRNVVWLKPKVLLESFADLFRNKVKTLASALAVLIICESLLVTLIGSEYNLIMKYIENSYRWYDGSYIYFTMAKLLAIIFGTMFFATVLKRCMQVNDLVIGYSICSLYIVAAASYVIPSRMWKYFIILTFNLFHGAIVTIVTSLTSKMIETNELGRLNSIQTSVNSLLAIGVFAVYDSIHAHENYSELCHVCLVTIPYVILMLLISYVFMILYSKYRDFWKNYTISAQFKKAYTAIQ